MRKLLFVGAAVALGAAGCSPEIGSEAPTEVVVAQFDPSASPAVVPSPNDLALNPATGLVAAPIDPRSPEAQQEFTRDFVNTLNGFPTTLAATAKIEDLDPTSVPATVNETAVRFIDLLAGTPIATPAVTPSVSYDADTDTLSIRPPASGWPKGGRYAVALLGGEGGLKGTNGRKVVGSTTWAFARSPEPLVTCEDLTAPDCRTATELIPSTKTDPAERLKDQTASALRLEALRRAYKPVLDALEKRGVAREDVALLWTFRIVDMPEVTFDPAASIIPFPNDILRSPTTGRLNLPKPPNATPQQSAFIDGLNMLDGFSTTLATVSENSATQGVLEAGALLDVNKLAVGTRFLKLSNLTGGTPPNVRTCLNGCVPAAAHVAPQQLQFMPMTPLDERTQYGAVLTTDLMDTRGRRVMPSATFALLRLKAPLVDANGKSQVSVLTDVQANALEPLRKGLKPLFDGLELAAGLPRAKVALAWAFTTQSTLSNLQELRAWPASSTLPATPGYVIDITSAVWAQLPEATRPSLAKVFEGQITVASPAPMGPGKMLAPPAPRPQRIPFVLTIPAGTMPEGGWPVAIFGHGLTGGRLNALALANSLASPGYARATLAIDMPLHGERSNCAGISPQSPVNNPWDPDPITEPNQACVAAGQVCDTDPASESYGRCILADRSAATACDPASNGDVVCRVNNEGLCRAADSRCEGGGFKTNSYSSVSISGWNFINLANPFAARDNMRQFVVDMAQLNRVISGTGFNTALTAANGEALALNVAQVDYVGQSMGGMLGTLHSAVAPEVRRVALNVPGGTLSSVLVTSPAFAPAKAAFLRATGITDGSPQYYEFIGLLQTAFDSGDPLNYAHFLENGQAAEREAFIQYIKGDEVVPNPTTVSLIAAANRNPARVVEHYMFDPPASRVVEGLRHGFLLDRNVNPDPANPVLTAEGQKQVVRFLATGAKTEPQL